MDFLGFLWPNWDFSMGYSEKNKKFSPSRFRLRQTSELAISLVRPPRTQQRGGPDGRRRICIAQILNFGKESPRRVRLQPADRETNSGSGSLTPRSDAGLFRPTSGEIGEPERAAPAHQKAGGMRRKSHADCSIHVHFRRFSLVLGSKLNHAWQLSTQADVLRFMAYVRLAQIVLKKWLAAMRRC